MISKERDGESEARLSAGPSDIHPMRRGWAHWRGDVAFLCGMLTLTLLTGVSLSAVGNVLTAPSRASRSAATSRATTPFVTSAGSSSVSTACRVTSTAVTTDTAPGSSSPATANVIAATTRDYAVGQPNLAFMQGAVDAQDNLWVGAMDANTLDRISATSGSLLACSPPSGAGGIMQTTVDSQGEIWFTEQNANYIGEFTPSKQTFKTYPLGEVNGHGMGPQDLAFDTNGALWFTELTGGAIGRFDPATGVIRSYPVPAPAAGSPSLPFALAITGDGQVWFGDLSGGAVGRLDPATGAVQLYHLANPQAEIFSLAADATGRLWFTELEQGKIGMVDSRTGQVAEMPVPTTLGTVSGLYAITVTPNGAVWFASASLNALIRYIPQTGAFTFYTLALPASVPYGLSQDSTGNLWFTASRAPYNYVGELRP